MPFAANPALVLAWSEDLEKGVVRAPYLVRYSRAGKSLSYVAARHETQLDSATHRLIDGELDALEPQVVVIEGIESRLGYSHEKLVTMARELSLVELSRQGGESLYTMGRALERGIPFSGGEPSAPDVWRRWDRGRYDLRDLLFYCVVRQIPQWKREGSETTFEDLFSAFAQRLAAEYSFAGRSAYSLADFLGWYREKIGQDFDFAGFDSSMAAPYDEPDSSFTQRLSAHNGYIRDQHIVGVIAEQVRRYDKVLVVYGCGHFQAQRRVLEDMLGPGRQEPAH